MGVHLVYGLVRLTLGFGCTLSRSEFALHLAGQVCVGLTFGSIGGTTVQLYVFVPSLFIWTTGHFRSVVAHAGEESVVAGSMG